VRVSTNAWRRIQQWGVALLPLIVAHYVVLGKTTKWIEWASGKDPYPGPPGTLLGAAVVVLVLLLRGADWVTRAKARIMS
jgi:DMSO/TMAO reductase YedYZ heme-binding membrane subunit